MRTINALTLIATALFLSGCGNHYLLTSKFVMATQQESPPDIIETPTYRSEVAKIKTVAVKAPDSCSNFTVDERTGGAVSQEAVLKTTCGVEMAEIERALSKASYRVISWKVMAREMEGRNLSALQVSSNLGAQLLFQINSLEKSRRVLGKDARWERAYYRSNEFGDTLEEQAFDDETRSFLKYSFLDRFESSVDLKRLAVTLDANAVNVKDGETIWFYRWTLTDPAAADYQQKKLIFCKNPRLCFPVKPLARVSDAKADVYSAGESEAVSVAEKPEDREKALYDSLLKSIVDNLVTSFSQQKK
jgi:hypothetical protein